MRTHHPFPTPRVSAAMSVDGFDDGPPQGVPFQRVRVHEPRRLEVQRPVSPVFGFGAQLAREDSRRPERAAGANACSQRCQRPLSTALWRSLSLEDSPRGGSTLTEDVEISRESLEEEPQTLSDGRLIASLFNSRTLGLSKGGGVRRHTLLWATPVSYTHLTLPTILLV